MDDNRIWEFVEQDEHLVTRLTAQLAITRVLASFLINRAINDDRAANSFLYPGIHSLGDPFKLPFMEAAASRVGKAVRNREKVLVYGDYDVDGITATALLTLFLRRAGLEVATYLPDRVSEGYGLHLQPLCEARRAGISLAITVDCGTDCPEVIRAAAEEGVEIIVTDHHLPGDTRERPPANLCLVNPHLGDAEEFKSLAGVGVALELARAVARTLNRSEPGLKEEDVLRDYLDLAAIGTIADLAPLRGESRTIACLGLEKLRLAPRPAFTELCRQAGMKNRRVDTRTIGFMVGPRINAAGRMANANLALELFLSQDEAEITAIAERLELNNRARQKVEKKVFKAACDKISAHDLARDPVILLAEKDWHQGVLGIVAGKVAERYNRPAVIFSRNGTDQAKGSGRSIAGVDLFQAVQACAEHLVNFGGHQKAVGLTADWNKLPDLQEALARALIAQSPESDRSGQRVRVESVLDFHELTPGFIREVDMLSPFGEQNPEPVIATMAAQVQDYSRIVGKKHLKLWLKQKDVFLEAIGFGLSEWKDHLPAGTMVDVAYTPRIATFGETGRQQPAAGGQRLELKLHALRLAG